MPLGLYISVPFCRTKCTYCNFASDVFSRAVFQKYISRVCDEISSAHKTAEQVGGIVDRAVDSIYFGGGTPTLLDVAQLDRIFVTIRQNFDVQPDAEITLECAPGTLSEPMVETLVRCGVNRVSLGVQSFVDQESASVGRLHKREVVLDDIARLRSAGISNINVDLIAGLPHQGRESWEHSLNELIATGVPHASVYMLEVDEDSRLGRELLAGGQKYHAHFVPDEDLTADFYEIACERLDAAGSQQYEISNFAREGCESKHNLKYWTRQPYLGFGVDAHSLLLANSGFQSQMEREAQSADTTHGLAAEHEREGHDFQSCRNRPESTDGTAESRALTESADCIRFANPENLEQYVSAAPRTETIVSCDAALQETLFLGLRLNRGVSLDQLSRDFGQAALSGLNENVTELVSEGLLLRQDDIIRLTPRGRLLSNEVFERFVSVPSAL
jgi:oxygen-independent coproporphyrinogen III oxidase